MGREREEHALDAGQSEPDIGAWIAELARNAPGLLTAYLPMTGFSARSREEVIVAVAEASGSPVVAWVHRSWAGFVGPAEGASGLDVLLDMAEAAGAAGHPVDTTLLHVDHPVGVVRAARATVARAGLACCVERSVRGIASQAARTRVDPLDRLASQLVTAGVGVPLAIPSLLLAAAMNAATFVAPRLPDVDLPAGDESNLVVHLVAESVPAHLGHVLVRAIALANPYTVGVAFRMDGTAATLRVGSGKVTVEDGVHPKALFVVDGPLDSVLRRAAASVARQLVTGMR